MNDSSLKVSPLLIPEDAELVNVSNTAQIVGIPFPVCVTQKIYRIVVAVPPKLGWMYEHERLLEMLVELKHAIKKAKNGVFVRFTMLVQTARKRCQHMELVGECKPDEKLNPLMVVRFADEEQKSSEM